MYHRLNNNLIYFHISRISFGTSTNRFKFPGTAFPDQTLKHTLTHKNTHAFCVRRDGGDELTIRFASFALLIATLLCATACVRSIAPCVSASSGVDDVCASRVTHTSECVCVAVCANHARHMVRGGPRCHLGN